MKETLHQHHKTEAAFETAEEPSSFRDEVRAIVFPEKKWHYVFHAMVILIALAYWIGALLKLPDASWAEIVMYRPSGDNQVFPAITAVSKFNFGDPTDALSYGKGIGGFHAVILLPYAMAHAVFGPAGYMIADVLLSMGYFVIAAIFLRRCHLGNLTCLVVASALASGSLQGLSHKLSTVVTKFFAIMGLFTGEWQFPPLFNLVIFDKRIPRPMVTEIFLVLALYLLVRQWQDRRCPSFRWGLAVGAVMAMLAQGDPYAFAATGLILVGVMAATMGRNRWKIPWHCALGGTIGMLVCGSYFVVQLLNQSAESAVRFGLVNYGRSAIWFLPGYGPLVRILVIGALTVLVILASRHLLKPMEIHGGAKSDHFGHRSVGTKPVLTCDGGLFAFPPVSIALFCLLMVIAAWLAQPVQMLLLGKGAQIYHYLLYTLPVFYGYAVLILVLHLVQIGFPQALQKLGHEFRQRLNWATAGLLGLALFLQAAFGVEESLEAIMASNTSREEFSPWISLGDRYRRNLRALDQEFRNNPALRQARSFGTFCHEVNFLLTAFHEKRAFLPDNGFTTLSDKELESRLCEVSKICGMPTELFVQFIQHPTIMNYWLGCAKYWFSPDHIFSSRDDYLPKQLESMKTMGKQNPWSLALPKSEVQRLIARYLETLSQPPDLKRYPDIMVMTVLLKDQGIFPRLPWYKEIYTNEVFSVYSRPLGTNSLWPGNVTSVLPVAQP